MNAPSKHLIPLHVLRGTWMQAKIDENNAKNERLAIEAEILKHFPADKVEGSVTDSDHGVTVTYKVTRKVESDRLSAAWQSLPPEVQGAFRWSADVDTKTLRHLDDNAMALAVEFFTTTPSKPAITMKERKHVN